MQKYSFINPQCALDLTQSDLLKIYHLNKPKSLVFKLVSYSFIAVPRANLDHNVDVDLPTV